MFSAISNFLFGAEKTQPTETPVECDVIEDDEWMLVDFAGDKENIPVNLNVQDADVSITFIDGNHSIHSDVSSDDLCNDVDDDICSDDHSSDGRTGDICSDSIGSDDISGEDSCSDNNDYNEEDDDDDCCEDNVEVFEIEPSSTEETKPRALFEEFSKIHRHRKSCYVLVPVFINFDNLNPLTRLKFLRNVTYANTDNYPIVCYSRPTLFCKYENFGDNARNAKFRAWARMVLRAKARAAENLASLRSSSNQYELFIKLKQMALDRLKLEPEMKRPVTKDQLLDVPPHRHFIVDLKPPVRMAKKDYMKHIKDEVTSQQAKEYESKKYITKGQLNRKNKACMYESSNKNRHRRDLWQRNSGANNNRKCY